MVQPVLVRTSSSLYFKNTSILSSFCLQFYSFLLPRVNSLLHSGRCVHWPLSAYTSVCIIAHIYHIWNALHHLFHLSEVHASFKAQFNAIYILYYSPSDIIPYIYTLLVITAFTKLLFKRGFHLEIIISPCNLFLSGSPYCVLWIEKIHYIG